MGRWGDGKMGRWGDEEMGRWGDGEIGDWQSGRVADWQRAGALIIALMMMKLTWLRAAAADHLQSSHDFSPDVDA